MPAKAISGPPSPASLAPTRAINPPIGGFFVPEFQAKKSQRLSWLERSDESGGVCGHFGVVGNQRNECVLLTVGELAEALQQFAFVQ